MARPKNKADLLLLGEKNYNRLIELVDSYGAEKQITEFPAGTLNRNIGDVLMHLHHWHLLLKTWYTEGLKGIKPEMPATGYTWQTTPLLNDWIQKKYANTSVADAKNSLKESYELIRGIIKSLSDEELFEKKRYKWTGSTSAGSYFISATSSHYEWAYKLIKKAMKGVAVSSDTI